MEKHFSLYDSSPLIQLYYKILILLLNDNEQQFNELKDLLNNHSDEITSFVKYNTYTILDNFCQSRIFSGEVSFVRKKFELFREQLYNKSVYGANNYFDNILFQNIVKTSVTLKENDWCEKFMEQYKDELSPYYKNNTYNYCKAFFHYSKKEFGEALNLLSVVQNVDFAFKQEIKSLMIMIYYDMDDTEPFLSVIDSFRHYLSNNKESSLRYKTIYLNFLDYSFKLFKLKEKFNAFDVSKLRKEIINKKDIGKKSWLLAKLDELES